MLTLTLIERNNSIMDIKRLRQASGLSQREFCMMYRIPLKTLQNWESGEDLPSARKCPPYVSFLLEKALMADFSIVKNLLLANVDESHLTTIQHAKSQIRKSPLSRYVKDVVLYGSTARGQSKPFSDVDILMVLDEKVKNRKQYNDWITYLKGNISTDDYTLPETDLHVAFYDNWVENNNAFLSNIRKEGFSIWN